MSGRFWLLVLLSLAVAGCFDDDLTADDLCSVELPECDSDGDGALNGVDDFPLDAACSVMSDDDCFACGEGCVYGSCLSIGECACGGVATGLACDACPDNWTGDSCDTCANGWSGPSCDSCSANWQGDACNDCADNWTGEECETCVNGWKGTNCDVCPPNWTGDNCDVCAPGWTGDGCETCPEDPDDPWSACDDPATDPCMSLVCDPTAGCFYEVLEDGTDCDAGDACVVATKCSAGVCTGGSANPQCKCLSGLNSECAAKPFDDGDACNGQYECINKQCVLSDPVECTLTGLEPCQFNGCDTDTGFCSLTTAEEATPCDEGSGTCQAGICAEQN